MEQGRICEIPLPLCKLQSERMLYGKSLNMLSSTPALSHLAECCEYVMSPSVKAQVNRARLLHLLSL